MKYVDRDGLEITAEEWAKLFRNRRYALVREDGDGQEVVITSWVGVLCPETDRDLYFVDRQVCEDGLHWRSIAESWHPTEKAALREHRRILNEIRRKPQIDERPLLSA